MPETGGEAVLKKAVRAHEGAERLFSARGGTQKRDARTRYEAEEVKQEKGERRPAHPKWMR